MQRSHLPLVWKVRYAELPPACTAEAAQDRATHETAEADRDPARDEATTSHDHDRISDDSTRVQEMYADEQEEITKLRDSQKDVDADLDQTAALLAEAADKLRGTRPPGPQELGSQPGGSPDRDVRNQPEIIEIQDDSGDQYEYDDEDNSGDQGAPTRLGALCPATRQH
ncbi:hypothetical protein PI124_g23695 [Phytophthora idaei]|nr:hypothetical protein PI124_g23695 [Phytophthora idaei]